MASVASVAPALLAALSTTTMAVAAAAAGTVAQPHIFMVVVDDFGWADAGWHRGDGGGLPVTKEVVTPTMDALVKEGIELNRHYVHMMCTPTRSSFQVRRTHWGTPLTTASRFLRSPTEWDPADHRESPLACAHRAAGSRYMSLRSCPARATATAQFLAT